MNGYIGAIERLALENDFFRQVLFTAGHAQLVPMSLQPGEQIGAEAHAGVDPFFRIEGGEATFVVDASRSAPVATGRRLGPRPEVPDAVPEP
ncbi:MAG: hypothetical protein K8H90_02570 [Thermoanaerobaculia bacterium]|nr:hypothetical protein [Thermoanaerobaculia bacterium]